MKTINYITALDFQKSALIIGSDWNILFVMISIALLTILFLGKNRLIGKK